MNIKNLFSIFIEFIISPSIISIIGILSFVSAVVALIVAWRAYRLQQKSDKDLKRVESNIDKLENNVTEVSTISLQTQHNVNKSYFQIERTTAINKYPEREEFKKVNEAYLNFIFPLFDIECANIGITVKTNFDLHYKIKFIKDKIGVPLKKESLDSSFYIIEIISPAYSEVLKETELKEYEKSPIKEGEYYACWLDESKCSWFLGQQLCWATNYKYPFYVSGFSSEKAEIVPSANEVMGYNRNNYPGDGYNLIDKFIIGMDGSFPANSGSLFRLFQKESQIFFMIGNSPLKKIYILRTHIQTQRKRFLVFENLRGHIRNDDFIEKFKNMILKKINRSDLPEKAMDSINYEKNYHIKIPLENS